MVDLEVVEQRGEHGIWPETPWTLEAAQALRCVGGGAAFCEPDLRLVQLVVVVEEAKDDRGLSSVRGYSYYVQTDACLGGCSGIGDGGRTGGGGLARVHAAAITWTQMTKHNIDKAKKDEAMQRTVRARPLLRHSALQWHRYHSSARPPYNTMMRSEDRKVATDLLLVWLCPVLSLGTYRRLRARKSAPLCFLRIASRR